MLDRENRAVDFLAHLHLVAAVDEEDGAVGKHDGEPGRAGEAGEPGEALGARRHVFVLEAVGARHHEAVEPAPRELGAQCCDARRAGAAVAAILERLETRREHGGNLGAGAAAGNGAAAARAAHQHQRGPAVEVDAPFERASAIGGQRGVRLRRQQAGQDDAGAGRGQLLQWRGDALQRSEQDIGEDEIERRAPADFARG